MALTLKVKSSDGTVTTLSGVVKLTTGSSCTQLAGDPQDKTVTISENRQSYLDWYNTQVANKRLAISGVYSAEPDSESSSESSDSQPGFSYYFDRGVSAYIYGENSSPYLLSIQSSTPDNTGNLQILPGKTVDVSEGAGEIYLSKLSTGIINDPGTVYREINVFLWYLYHALNFQVYRLQKFNPSVTGNPAFRDSHLLGTIPSYQALVARWNYLVWKRSFLSKVSQSGETLNFSLGYSGVSCTATVVKLSATLTLINDEDAFDSTIKFFTLYSQGVNTSLTKIPTYRITKYTDKESSGSSSTVEVQGHGTDPWAGSNTWKRITIEIPGSSDDGIILSQGEYYNAAFSLAVALNEKTTYFYQSIGNDQFTFSLDIEWAVNDDTGTHTYTEHQDDLRVRTILLHSETSADAGSIDYNVKG